MTEYTHHMTEYTPAKTGEYQSDIPQFSLSHIHNLYFAFHRIKSLFLTMKYYTFSKEYSFNCSEDCSRVSKWIERRKDFGSQLTTLTWLAYDRLADHACWEKHKTINTTASNQLQNMLRYLFVDIVCSLMLTVFLELCLW